MQKREREDGFAEAALRASHADVSAMTAFWSWRVSAMQEALRLLHEERELQAVVMRKMDEQVALFESERGNEEEGEIISPQQQQCDSSKAKYEPSW